MAIPQRYALLTEMRLEQALANYLREILLKSAQGISKDITALGKDGEPLTQMQLNAQLKSIQAVLEQDFSNLETAIAQGKVEAAKQASAVVSRYESQLLAAVMAPDAVRRIAKGEVQRTVAGLEAALQRIKGRSYKPLSSQVYDTRKLANGWVSDKINQALVSGWDARRLAREIRQSISPDVPGGVSYAANRLARTEINNAFHAASAERYENSPIVESVDWHLSTSHPEGDECDGLAENGPYPKDAVPEKPHPNCYCYITPHLPSKDEFLENLLAGKYDDADWVEEATGEAGFDELLKDAQRDARSGIDQDELDWLSKPGRESSLNDRIWRDQNDRLQSDYLVKVGMHNPEILQRYFNNDDSFLINQALRNGEKASSEVQEIIDVFNRYELPESTITYRGVWDMDLSDNMTGALWQDAGFQSTTFDKSRAQNWAASRGDNVTVFEIVTPKGTKVALDPYQSELALQAGATIRIVEDTTEEFAGRTLRVLRGYVES